MNEQRWNQLTLIEQLGNIGSEISRALNWQKKGNKVYCHKAVDRALELLALTMNSVAGPCRYRELTNVKKAIIDYFYGPNQYKSTPKLWRNYFDYFAYAARKQL